MRRAAPLLLSLLVPARAGAQTHPTVAEHIVLGDSAHAALAPAQALQHYRAALAADSTNYAALWKAGRELVDIAKQVQGKDDSSKHLRDSLYTARRRCGSTPPEQTGTSRSDRRWAGCRAPKAAKSRCASPRSSTMRG